MDQITSSNGNKLLEWKQIPSKNNISLRGKIPKWFKKLEEITIIDETRTLKPEYRINNNTYKSKNKRILLSTKIDSRKNNWIAGIKDKNGKNIYIGLLNTKKPEIYIEEKINIIHYTVIDSNNIINKTNSIHLKKCTGCYIGRKENSHCII